MKYSREKGFSVVESIIYLALTALFMVLIIDTLVSISGSYRKLTLARVLSHSASVSMERMTRELRTASDIDPVGSVFDSDFGRVVLHTTDANGVVGTVLFALEDGAVVLYENGVLTGRLTTLSASTTSLFLHFYDNGTSEALSIDMTLEATRGDETRVESFRTMVTLRNSP